MFLKTLMAAAFVASLTASGAVAANHGGAKSGKVEHEHFHTDSRHLDTSGVGGAEGCETILSLGCNTAASDYWKMMQQQRDLETAPLAVPLKGGHQPTGGTSRHHN